MSSIFKTTWEALIRPLIRRPDRVQVAALCHRMHEGRREILLLTSRDTGRWVLPKGWPVDGEDGPGSARVEAWEEGGVEPKSVGRTAIGLFHYDKRLEGGVPVPCETRVYPIEVARLADDFPQRHERERRWVTPEEAAGMVDEPELRNLLQSLPDRMPG